MNHLPLHIRLRKRHFALIALVFLAFSLCYCAYMIFFGHGDEHLGHVFDVSALLFGERALTFLMGSAAAAE